MEANRQSRMISLYILGPIVLIDAFTIKDDAQGGYSSSKGNGNIRELPIPKIQMSHLVIWLFWGLTAL